LIDGVFNLPSLGYPDARSDDLPDYFDLTQLPPVFNSIPTIFNAKYFLSDKRSPLPPDDDDR
jgi:hypothetical protein